MCTSEPNIKENKVFLGGVGMALNTVGGVGTVRDLATHLTTWSKGTQCSSEDEVV